MLSLPAPLRSGTPIAFLVLGREQGAKEGKVASVVTWQALHITDNTVYRRVRVQLGLQIAAGMHGGSLSNTVSRLNRCHPLETPSLSDCLATRHHASAPQSHSALLFRHQTTETLYCLLLRVAPTRTLFCTTPINMCFLALCWVPLHCNALPIGSLHCPVWLGLVCQPHWPHVQSPRGASLGAEGDSQLARTGCLRFH